jgi:hypothetical protein
MLVSSRGSVFGVVGLSGAQDGVQDVDPPSSQSKDGLVVALPLAAFALVERLAGRVETMTRRSSRIRSGRRSPAHRADRSCSPRHVSPAGPG